MATEETTEKFYFEKCVLSEDGDSELEYGWVDEDAGGSSLDNYETLDNIVKKMQECKREKEVELVTEVKVKPSVTCPHELPEDYIRNFLVAMGMQRSLDVFQHEWFLMEQKNLVKPSDFEGVNEMYGWNLHLTRSIIDHRKEIDKLTNITSGCRERLKRVIKERNHHRLQHRRLQQEKDRCRLELKRLREKYAHFEPALAQLTTKHCMAMREKLHLKKKLKLTEEDFQKLIVKRFSSQVTANFTPVIHNINNHIISNNNNYNNNNNNNNNNFNETIENKKLTPTNNNKNNNNNKYAKANDENNNNNNKDALNNKNKNNSVICGASEQDSKFPIDTRYNPKLSSVLLPCPYLLRRDGFERGSVVVAHDQTVTSIKVHEETHKMATTSDDMTWKVWDLHSFDLQLVGQGHLDWISDCDIDPGGTRIATVSGDTSLKIWDLSNADCLHTFNKHRKAVWGVTWNHGGDFVATCSNDNTAKLWDLNSMRCRYTLRGHSDSVNAIHFLNHSNILATCSTDTTVCIWDARTNLCGGIYKGHKHSVNSCDFSMKGHLIVSCDSGGHMIVWDLRKREVLTEISFKPCPVVNPSHPITPLQASTLPVRSFGHLSCNQCSFDATSSVVAVACSDGVVRMVDLSVQKTRSLEGHEDSVQCLNYADSGEYLLSGANDCSVRKWK